MKLTTKSIPILKCIHILKEIGSTIQMKMVLLNLKIKRFYSYNVFKKSSHNSNFFCNRQNSLSASDFFLNHIYSKNFIDEDKIQRMQSSS